MYMCKKKSQRKSEDREREAVVAVVGVAALARVTVQQCRIYRSVVEPEIDRQKHQVSRTSNAREFRPAIPLPCWCPYTLR